MAGDGNIAISSLTERHHGIVHNVMLFISGKMETYCIPMNSPNPNPPADTCGSACAEPGQSIKRIIGSFLKGYVRALKMIYSEIETSQAGAFQRYFTFLNL